MEQTRAMKVYQIRPAVAAINTIVEGSWSCECETKVSVAISDKVMRSKWT